MKLSHRFVVLDGLRGIAAIVIVQWHFSNWFNGFHVGSGYLAVDFFFLLSGYVLEFAYGDKLRSTMTVVGFFRTRLARLYPTYLLSVLITVYAIHFVYTSLQLLLAVLMLPETDGVWGVAPAWSLVFELLVNLIFAVFYETLGLFELAAICVCSFFGLLLAFRTYGTLDVGYSVDTFVGGIPRVLFSFFLGVIIFRKRDLLSIFIPTSAAFSCLALIGILIYPGHDILGIEYDLIAIAVVFPIVLISASNATAGRISSYMFSRGGLLSYPTYILHTSLGAILFRWGLWPFIEAHFAWAGILALGYICFISLAVERFIDRPTRQLINAVKIYGKAA